MGRTRTHDWLDSATDGAAQSTPPDGMTYTSLDPTVKFLRRMNAGTVRAVGTAINSSCLLLPVPDHRA
ncbi:hypothetical protein ACFRFU_45645 [Streptomyces sp. NPDC056704]|uniref:hypothetical protein n=1 Tax=Streptomyces sp. NPDC056704 TaxID=3345917 RepID=UPI00368FC65C